MIFLVAYCPECGEIRSCRSKYRFLDKYEAKAWAYPLVKSGCEIMESYTSEGMRCKCDIGEDYSWVNFI
jgi:hypothetical protein